MDDLLMSKYGRQIEVLNKTLWENRALGPKVNEWLANFADNEEKKYALYILSRLTYFNDHDIRFLLKVLYRDLYRYPIIQEIRDLNYGTYEDNIIETEFKSRLQKTRFLGVGNLSESGTYLLYYFRQENKIPKDLFISSDNVLLYVADCDLHIQNAFSDVSHYVFIDDMCGTGKQATSDSSSVKTCVANIRKNHPDAKISYYMLFGMTTGINRIRESGLYDSVEALIELDDSYRCFHEQSRYFIDGEYNIQKAKEIMYKYGTRLLGEKRALGYGNCQLLISMHHNTPDNTLPVIWYDEDNKWTPIFKRYNKIYK